MNLSTNEIAKIINIPINVNELGRCQLEKNLN